MNPSIHCPTDEADPDYGYCTPHCFVEYKVLSKVGDKVGHKTNSGLRLTFSSLTMCRCVKAGTSHIWILTVKVSPQCLVQETFLPKNWAILEELMWSPRPSVTWHEATILCCLSNIQKNQKKINATWQHYIKSFCVLIFLFCLCTFVWGAESCSRGPVGAEPARTMWESRAETAHVVLSLRFLLWLQKRLHLYRPFHVSTSSISADRLERTFCTSPRLNPWIPLRWRLQNQQCHGCETLQHTGLMCGIKIKSV